MRRVRVIPVLLATAACLAVASPAQALAAAPPCPDELEALAMEAPGYARTGDGIPVTIAAEHPERISFASLTSGPEGAVTPIVLSGNRTTVVLGARPVEPAFEIQLRWIQDEGTLASCEGAIVATIPVIPRLGRAGDPLAPRFTGRFRVFERSVNPPERRVFKPVWRFQPKCRYFGCATAVESSARLRGTFQLLGNGGYELLTRFPPDTPCVESKTERVIQRRGYREVVRIRIEVKPDPTGERVESFSGTIRTYWEATPRAQAKDCSPIGRYGTSQRVRGERIQG